MPWHLSDPFFQEVPGRRRARRRPLLRGQKDLEDLTRETYDNLGLEVRDVMAGVISTSGKARTSTPSASRVGREYPYDVRVLANVRPDAYWIDAMLHEFGHAVYDRYINPGLPYLLRTIAHICTTEAIALMMGSLAEDPGWLQNRSRRLRGELDGDRRKPRRSAPGRRARLHPLGAGDVPLRAGALRRPRPGGPERRCGGTSWNGSSSSTVRPDVTSQTGRPRSTSP